MAALGYLHDLNMLTNLDDAAITFKKLLKQVQAHFGAITIKLVARYEFCRLSQNNSGSVDDYATSLRISSVQCSFRADFNVRLRDQLVLGLNNEAKWKRLMERNGISFGDAFKLAFDLKGITQDSMLNGKAEISVLIMRTLRRRIKSRVNHTLRTTHRDHHRKTCRALMRDQMNAVNNSKYVVSPNCA